MRLFDNILLLMKEAILDIQRIAQILDPRRAKFAWVLFEAMLRQAGWNAENYMRMDGILQAFEDTVRFGCG